MKISGTDVLVKELKKRANMKDVENVVKLNGAEMQAKAQRRASVDTGFMKRSITLEIRDNGMTAVVKSNAQYSGYVNYGTRFQAANPFMTSSFNEQKLRFIGDLKRLTK